MLRGWQLVRRQTPHVRFARMLSSLRIFHPPSSDNPTGLPILVLRVDRDVFMFNAPESSTRALVQHGAYGAFKGLRSILVPRAGNDECGGLPGLLMTVADQGMRRIELCGPPLVSDLIATARNYTTRQTLRVDIREGPSPDPSSSSRPGHIVLQDKAVTITAVQVLPVGFKAPHDGHTPIRPAHKKPRTGPPKGRRQAKIVQDRLSTMFHNESGLMREKKAEPQTNVGSSGESSDQSAANGRSSNFDNRWASPSLSPVHLSDSHDGQAPVLIYIIKNGAKRGSLKMDRIRALGVADTRLYKKITNGEDVQTERPKGYLEWDEKRRAAWFAWSSQRSKAINNSWRNKLSAEEKARLDAAATSKPSEYDALETETVLVRQSDVMTPATPEVVSTQVYLPSIDYLPGFLDNAVQSYFTELKDIPHVIVHAVHPSVLQDPRYKAFILRFPSTHHIIATRSFLPDKPTFSSSFASTLRMSYLDKELFKVPPYTTTPQHNLGEIGLHNWQGTGSLQLTGMDVDVSLVPKRAPVPQLQASAPDIAWPIDSAEAVQLASFQRALASPAQMLNQARDRQRWKKYLEAVAAVHKDGAVEEDAVSGDGLRITTLGTGSSVPSKYRNVSATLVHLPRDGGYILLDAGEGTYGQLCRKFGAEVDEVMRKIRLIFLSHAHGDHHMGVTKILTMRKLLRLDEPLFVVTNTMVRTYLTEVDTIQPLDLCDFANLTSARRGVVLLNAADLDFVHGVRPDPDAGVASDAEGMDVDGAVTPDERWARQLERQQDNFLSRSKQEWTEGEKRKKLEETMNGQRWRREASRKQLDQLQEALNGTRVFTALVDHRASQCYGIVLRNDGWSLAFSGDSRPCDNFARAGKGVELLIHEATFENDEEEMAKLKGHSTVGQATRIAHAMGARRLLLTHFSQRYPKIPRMMPRESTASETNGEAGLSIGVAFDLMTMSLQDIGKTERYGEALQVLLEDEDGTAAGEEDGEPVAPMTDDDTGAGVQDEQHSTVANGKQVPSEGNPDAQLKGDQTFAPSTVDIGTPTDKTDVSRQIVKEHAFAYVVAYLSPQLSSSERKPSRLTFDDALRDKLEQMHGVVGASFLRDIVFFDDHCRSDTADQWPGIVAVVKVASRHVQTLSTVFSAGVVVQHGAHNPFVTRNVGVLSAFDLPALHAMMASHSSSSQRPQLEPPGRAWMQNVVKDGSQH